MIPGASLLIEYSQACCFIEKAVDQSTFIACKFESNIEVWMLSMSGPVSPLVSSTGHAIMMAISRALRLLAVEFNLAVVVRRAVEVHVLPVGF